MYNAAKFDSLSVSTLETLSINKKGSYIFIKAQSVLMTGKNLHVAFVSSSI